MRQVKPRGAGHDHAKEQRNPCANTGLLLYQKMKRDKLSLNRLDNLLSLYKGLVRGIFLHMKNNILSLELILQAGRLIKCINKRGAKDVK